MFGLVDTSTTSATGFVQLVADRRAVTLLPIIQAHAVIHSDSWAAYNIV